MDTAAVSVSNELSSKFPAFSYFFFVFKLIVLEILIAIAMERARGFTPRYVCVAVRPDIKAIVVRSVCSHRFMSLHHIESDM
jgi:hypothetical protein